MLPREEREARDPHRHHAERAEPDVEPPPEGEGAPEARPERGAPAPCERRVVVDRRTIPCPAAVHPLALIHVRHAGSPDDSTVMATVTCPDRQATAYYRTV